MSEAPLMLTLTEKKNGRPRKHQTDAEKYKAYRARKRHETSKPMSSTRGGLSAILCSEQTSNINGLQNSPRHETPPSAESDRNWLRVNDVTWKLTDGTHTVTPSVHGKWGSFKIEKALAWVFDAGWPGGLQRYFVRCKGKKAGPFDNLRDAQGAAEYLLQGAGTKARSEAIAMKMV